MEDEEVAGNKTSIVSFIDSLLKKPGFSLYANYSIMGAYYPGWSYPVWDQRFNGREIFQDNQPFALEMHAKVGFDVRLSPELGFWQAVKFSVPGMKIDLIEFYGEYVLANSAFLKIGIYDYNWGISPNYKYANLLSRVPADISTYPGDLYLARATIPVNIGGIELLSFTRSSYVNMDQPELSEFAFGAKFNLALKQFDFNIGSVYFKRMPLRGMLSFKSTILKDVEIYAESVLSVDHEAWQQWQFSGSFGLYNDFFNNRLRVNAEIFYNGENETFYLRKENPLEDKKNVYPFIPGINLALNIDYHYQNKLKMRLGVTCVYAVEDGSGQIIPGLSLEPVKHMNIYIAAPFVVGYRSDNSYSYYVKNNDKQNRPLSLVFAISINGAFEFAHY